MFGDINRVSLMGNVTKDPDLRFTPSGSAVLSFGLATNRRYKKGEQWQDEAQFHNIVIWNGAESLAQRIKKGTRLYLDGRIQTRSWDGQDGKKQYKTEIVGEKVILIARYEGAGEGSAPEGSSSEPKSAEVEDSAEEEIDPSDLPF